MPTFDITIQGKSYHVEIPDPGACPLVVIVDGEPFEVGVAGTDVRARPTAVPEPPPPASEPPAIPAPVQRAGPRSVASGIQTAGTGGDEVRAPMPGTILSVNVTVGQVVNTKDVLCVLEAMKMKNPIRAMHEGTISEIVVQAGQSVAHGALLMKLT